MSIARAFTTRRVKQSLMAADAADSNPQRSNATKSAVGSIRHKISAPVELIHTTNMLSYNAPDIYPKTAGSTTSSHRSDDELSDTHTTASSPPTSPDVETPKRSLSTKPNHLSSFFTVSEENNASPQVETPVIPQRAASHTKKSYDSLVRQRSSSRMSEQSQRSVSTKASLTFSRSSSTSTSTTATSQSASPPQHKARPSNSRTMVAPQPAVAVAPEVSSPLNHRKEFSQSQHPFGPELAQVSEIAEEYGVKAQVNEVDLEAQELAAKGLQRFTAEDYMSEIQGLISSFFTDSKPIATAMWI